MDEVTKQLEELKGLIEQLNNIENYSPNSENNIDDLDLPLEEFKMITKFVNNSTNPDPQYAKKGDSGFDLRAFLNDPVVLKPLERKLIPTGLQFELLPNTELQVRPRSGLSLKHGITVLNTPGTVDEGYRGDVGIIVINLSDEKYTINSGDRIAQGVIMNVISQNISYLNKIEKINETQRGADGFGSTGIN